MATRNPKLAASTVPAVEGVTNLLRANCHNETNDAHAHPCGEDGNQTWDATHQQNLRLSTFASEETPQCHLMYAEKERIE